MKKKLDEAGVMDELSQSLFFQPPKGQKTTKSRQRESGSQSPNKSTSPISKKARTGTRKPVSPYGSPVTRTPVRPESHTGGREEMKNEVAIHGHMEDVRKTVRKVGRERVEVTLTDKEKEALLEIAFLRNKKGNQRTTSIDILRVALNWLLEDHKISKNKSLLSRTLDKIQN